MYHRVTLCNFCLGYNVVDMEIYWQVMVFIFGTIIGSFLNVVLYRFHTGKSLNGRSHCMTCGKTLSWYELFPIVSYILQWGKCRVCSAHIPIRYLVVELSVGFAYLVLWNLFQDNFVLLVLYFALTALLTLIVVYDLRHTIIPDELTLMIGGIASIYIGYEYIQHHDVLRVLMRIGAGLGAGFFFWGLWYVSKGRWIGLGDAKLALPLGMLVGLMDVFSMVVFSFWIGAGISVSFLGIQKILKKGKTNLHFLSLPLTMKSEVPFAPFLILGFIAVHFFHADIFEITYTLFLS